MKLHSMYQCYTNCHLLNSKSIIATISLLESLVKQITLPPELILPLITECYD